MMVYREKMSGNGMEIKKTPDDLKSQDALTFSMPMLEVKYTSFRKLFLRNIC